MVIIGKKTIAKNGPVNRVPTIIKNYAINIALFLYLKTKFLLQHFEVKLFDFKKMSKRK